MNNAGRDAEGTLLSADVSDTVVLRQAAQNANGPGVGNRVKLLVRQCEFNSGGPFVAQSQIGSVNASNNTVEVVGNAVAPAQTNPGLPKPADPADPGANLFSGGN